MSLSRRAMRRARCTLGRSVSLELLAGLVLLALWGAACESPAVRAERERLANRISASYNSQTGRLEKLAYDANDNKRPDTWAFMDGTVLLRIEIDENEDGVVDRRELFSPEVSANPERSSGLVHGIRRGSLVRIESSTAYDGRMTRCEFYEGGRLARVEEDTDRDGKVDKWESYVGGALSTVVIASAHTGKPARRLVYRVDGELDRSEALVTGEQDGPDPGVAARGTDPVGRNDVITRP